MKKVLLIGSNGYIGSRLKEELKGCEITTMDSCNLDKQSFLGVDYIMNYKNITYSIISSFDVVVLLAGHSSVNMCIKSDVLKVMNNNVNNFINLCEAINYTSAIFKKRIKLIYASSSSVYGSGKEVGTEDMKEEFNALNLYDYTKYVADLYAKSTQNLEYYGLRFGTVNGFSKNTRSDIMINSMFKSYAETGCISVTAKETRRPILGIKDLCRAVQTIIDCEENKKGIYNLASFNSTVEEISTKVAGILGCGINNVEDTNKDSKRYDFAISTSKFCNEFNFKFNETTESICKELKDNYSSITFINRNVSL